MAKRVILCTPDYFSVEYEINPWMNQSNSVDQKAAAKQWQNLYDTYVNKLGWAVEVVPAAAGLADVVFATDSCVIAKERVFVCSFRYKERQAEPAVYTDWLVKHGYSNLKVANNYCEGGDVLVCGELILAGSGFRSDQAAHKQLEDFFKLPVISLRLVDDCFYHLDTAVAVLSNDTVAVYPDALDAVSLKKLTSAIPNVIRVTRKEALSFGLNVTSDGANVVMSTGSISLQEKYQKAGFIVTALNTTEFLKAGGGVHCLTLQIDHV